MFEHTGLKLYLSVVGVKLSRAEFADRQVHFRQPTFEFTLQSSFRLTEVRSPNPAVQEVVAGHTQKGDSKFPVALQDFRGEVRKRTNNSEVQSPVKTKCLKTQC